MLTLEFSTEIEKELEEIAAQNNQTASDFVRQIIEKELKNGKSINGNGAKKDAEPVKRKKNYMEMVGMFSSGKTDTSEKMSEMQNFDFDSREGFSVK